jgi:hypothetical protein
MVQGPGDLWIREKFISRLPFLFSFVWSFWEFGLFFLLDIPRLRSAHDRSVAPASLVFLFFVFCLEGFDSRSWSSLDIPPTFAALVIAQVGPALVFWFGRIQDSRV